MNDSFVNKLFPIENNSSSDKQSRRKSLLEKLKVCIILFLLYVVLTILKIGCPIKAYTGISCPGCGMTRAVIAALHLHFKEAIYYHPLFFLAPLLVLLFLFDDFIRRKWKIMIWSFIIMLFLGVYLHRLIFTASDVVTIDIWSGKVLELLHRIIA